MRRMFAGVVLSLLLLACPSSAFAGWTRLASEHFLFVGDVSARDLRDVATRLEHFRDAMVSVFAPVAPVSRAAFRIPTVVLVFRDDRSFAPFRPMFEGRPVAVAGYATSSEDTHYIAVNASRQQDADGLIFHEYTHLFLGETFGDVALWMNEGLAEFFETFETTDRGTRAVVGRANGGDLAVLQSSAHLGLAQLAAVDPESTLYNEGAERTLFYAESWALVHYLMFGGPEQSARLHQLLTTTAAGVPSSDAFTRVFGSDTAELERQLASYVRQENFAAQRLDVGVQATPGRRYGAEPLPEGEAAAYLGDALAHIGRLDAARTYLTRAIERSHSPRTTAMLGLLEMREGRLDVGQALLERALAQTPEMAAGQRWLGRALLERALHADADPQALYADARLALEWSLELEPEHPSALVALARVELNAGDPVRAATLLRSLIEAAPSREDYQLLFAEALVGQREYKAAIAYLGPLLARGRDAGTRTAARELMARIAKSRTS